jgi:hypothetical protein
MVKNNKTELMEVKKDTIGSGLLLEHDGYISMSDENNKSLNESINANGEWNIPHPFIVSAVFQKFGIKNANGRIYPEDILKREEQGSVVEKTTKKFSFPIEFEEEVAPSRVANRNILKVEKEKEVPKKVAELYPKKEEVKEKPKFKPTPVISPVYGVLDKNYHKEDIVSRNEVRTNRIEKSVPESSIDAIRNKAYGTLEDDLEITLFGRQEKVAENKEEEIDMFDELMDNNNDDDKFGDTEKIDSSDLFNLIDSMYEKEDDNNGIC